MSGVEARLDKADMLPRKTIPYKESMDLRSTLLVRSATAGHSFLVLRFLKDRINKGLNGEACIKALQQPLLGYSGPE